MSEDISKQLQNALTSIARLEAEIAPLRAKSREPAGLDPRAFAQQYVTDPIGTLQRLGLTPDLIQHSTRVHVAHAMGDQAPSELKVLASMGPQVSATSSLQSDVQALRQRLEQREREDAAKAARESFSALASDKAKYPHLSKALAANPKLFEEQFQKHGGTAEEFANAQEALAALYAPPPASEANADNQSPNSQQGKQAQVGGLDPTPPQLPRAPVGVFTQDDHVRLRDEIVRKNS